MPDHDFSSTISIQYFKDLKSQKYMLSMDSKTVCHVWCIPGLSGISYRPLCIDV